METPKENKAAKASENKTEAPDFLAQFEGKTLSVATFDEAYPGRGREIFDAVSVAGRHGYFPHPSDTYLGFPKKAADKKAINEAVAKLNLEK